MMKMVRAGAVALLLVPAGCLTRQVEKKPNTQQGRVIEQMLQTTAEKSGTGMDLREVDNVQGLRPSILGYTHGSHDRRP